jgi:formate dehydrogenase assembly factor FdhD
MNDTANRLHKIKQEVIMPDGPRTVHSTDAHYQRVQALTDEFPSNIQYGFSVTESFHNSLTQSIRDQIKAGVVNLPITAAMANVEQLNALCTIRSKCKECGEQNLEHLPNHQHECWPKSRLESQCVPSVGVRDQTQAWRL